MRNSGIELGRVAAMLAVICIHVQPGGLDAGWYGWVNQLARFGVPFFFIAMGYFARIGAPGEKTGQTALRLMLLYILWFAAYALAFGLPDPSTPENWAFGGVGVHLWFLTSAALSLLVVSVLVRVLGATGALLAGLALYGVAVALNSYSTPLLGQDFTLFDTRNGFFFAAPLIALGVWLSRTDLRVDRWAAAALFGASALMSVFEVTWLRAGYGLALTSHDFVLSTLPFGFTAFLLFRSLGGSSIAARVAPLGKFVLGIYLIHPALIRIASHVYVPHGPATFVVYVVAIFVASAAAAWAISKIPVLRLITSTSGSLGPRPRTVAAE